MRAPPHSRAQSHAAALVLHAALRSRRSGMKRPCAGTRSSAMRAEPSSGSPQSTVAATISAGNAGRAARGELPSSRPRTTPETRTRRAPHRRGSWSLGSVRWPMWPKRRFMTVCSKAVVLPSPCSFGAKRAAERHAVAWATVAVPAAAGARSPGSIIGRTPFPSSPAWPPDRSRSHCSSALPCAFSAKPQPFAACGSSGDRLGRTVALGMRRRAAMARASVSAPLLPLFLAVPGLDGHSIARLAPASTHPHRTWPWSVVDVATLQSLGCAVPPLERGPASER